MHISFYSKFELHFGKFQGAVQALSTSIDDLNQISNCANHFIMFYPYTKESLICFSGIKRGETWTVLNMSYNVFTPYFEW